jgi:hypothetical protein
MFLSPHTHTLQRPLRLISLITRLKKIMSVSTSVFPESNFVVNEQNVQHFSAAAAAAGEREENKLIIDCARTAV